MLSSLFLFWLVIALAVYMVLFRAYHRLRDRYRESRAAVYRPAIELVLMEEPFDAVLAALRPRRPGDGDVIQEVMLDSMRHLQGPPFETLRDAARRLGFVDANLRGLNASGRHARGRAIDRLGVMRLPEAVGPLAVRAEREDLELKLVALRSLAAIGDPACLPVFVTAAETIPPPLLPRLASLMFEFGKPGRAAVVEIVNRNPRLFPPLSVRDILLQLAQDYETSA